LLSFTLSTACKHTPKSQQKWKISACQILRALRLYATTLEIKIEAKAKNKI
jgi:hypothetical protein